MSRNPVNVLALAVAVASFAILLAAMPAAYAHGDHGDATPAATATSPTAPAAKSAVVREQKPWGIAGDAKAVARMVQLTMLDSMRFQPDEIAVRAGETLRIRVHSAGKLLHELVIGTPADNRAHAELMLKHPGMEHDEPYMVHVAPGKTGDIVWQFNRAGEFEFACLIDGHYQAGMTGRIRVTGNPDPRQSASVRRAP